MAGARSPSWRSTSSSGSPDRRGRPTTSGPGASPGSAFVREGDNGGVTTTHELIGRDDELAALRSVVGAAVSRGGTLLLSGEAGIGKSSLLAQAVREADAIGLRILRVAGVPAEADLPF